MDEPKAERPQFPPNLWPHQPAPEPLPQRPPALQVWVANSDAFKFGLFAGFGAMVGVAFFWLALWAWAKVNNEPPPALPPSPPRSWNG